MSAQSKRDRETTSFLHAPGSRPSYKKAYQLRTLPISAPTENPT